MSSPSWDSYTLTFYVPKDYTDLVTAAVHKTGAGTWRGDMYGETCFVVSGKGQFRPLDGANPHTGKVGELEHTDEDKVEIVIFGRDVVQKAVKTLKEVHPYEVAAYYVTKNEDF